jgi:4-amino-4-deoxy-L-arabinose transferase-like glycosyltransferase
VTLAVGESLTERDDRQVPAPPGEPGGARTVWRTAAVVGVVFAALILWQLLIPRDYVTGTNSVGVRSIVGMVERGQSLCVTDARIPAGTGGVRFAGFGAPETQVSVTARAGGRTVTGETVNTPGPGDRLNLDADFGERIGSEHGTPATVCLTVDQGAMQIGGMADLQGDQVANRLDGRAFRQRVALWYLPPAGDQRSLLSALPDVFDRAALFRPGFVGPWTYPLLLFVLLPLTWALGLVLLARAAGGRGGRLRPALLIALIAFVNAGAWALITPISDTPDEPDHIAYVQHLAETGEQPQQGQGDKPAFSTDLTDTLDGLRTYSVVTLGDARFPWLEADEQHWEQWRASHPHPADNGGGYTTAGAPHNPPYYALAALGYLAVGDSSPFSQITAMRIVSALLGAVVAAGAYGIVRELLPRRRAAAVAAGLLVAFHPMFTFMAGAVNNDNGVNAMAAVTLYLLIRALRRGPSWPLMACLGLAIALTPLMKGTGLAIYPAVAVGLVGLLWRHHHRASLPGWATLLGGVVVLRGLWAVVGGWFRPDGTVTGTAISATDSVGLARELPFRFANYLWQFFLPKLPGLQDLFVQRWPAFDIYVVQGWAAFGWYAYAFPKWVYVVVVAVMFAVAALAVAAVVRERVVARRLGWELAVVALVPICVAVAVEAAYFAPDGRPALAEQGRYIFPAIAALATIAVGGTFGLGRRWHVPLVTALVVAVIGFGFAARFVALAGFYT